MTIDNKILLFCLTNSIQTLGISLASNAAKYEKKFSSKFDQLSVDEKFYYSKYGLKLAKTLIEQISDVVKYDINDTENTEYHFTLVDGSKKKHYFSLSPSSINVNDVIPNKLMKICGYKGNANVYKFYQSKYQEINQVFQKKFHSKTKYSDIPDKKKNSLILEPVTDLVMDTLSKKRKCVDNLYNHLFSENTRYVIKTLKNYFVVYDFSLELEQLASFRMKKIDYNKIQFTFNNGAKFLLTLQTNSMLIKENLSLKFRTKFTNMDKLYSTGNIHLD